LFFDHQIKLVSPKTQDSSLNPSKFPFFSLHYGEYFPSEEMLKEKNKKTFKL
jgi:hypothetical protein